MKNFTEGFSVLFLLLIFSAAYSQSHFINKVPIPPLIDAQLDTIHLEMRQIFTHKFNPGDPTDSILNGTKNQSGIETWAYNIKGQTDMSILGPTLLWHTGKRTNIQVTNKLPQPATTHWHGAEVPAELDGGPHQPIATGETWPVSFTDLDSASTMWYHPHYHNNTFPHVLLGLSGMIISKQSVDPININLPKTYGIDDVPVIIGDLGLKLEMSGNRIDTVRIDTTKARRPYNLVNGVTNPYIELPAHLVRLRILNGSTRKGVMLGVSDSYNGDLSSLKDFKLVATDGGYTMNPVTMKSLLTGPGERAEIVLDLSSYNAGDSLYLRNLKDYMPESVVGSSLQPTGNSTQGTDTTGGNAFLQIRIIKDPENYLPVDVFTPFTSAWDPSLQDTLGVNKHRVKKLVGSPGSGFTIDGTTYDMMTINDTICEGAREIWTIDNQTSVSHPFHIHKIFFRILDIDSMGVMLDLEPLGLNGPKDDILVRPNWKVRFMAKFDDYPSAIDYKKSYMYHCHILTHEDAEGGGMMHQFVVTSDAQCKGDPVAVRSIKDFSNSMILYPNPAKNELFLKGQSAGPGVVSIIDILGRTIKEQKLPAFSGTSTIDIDGMLKGFYLVRWSSGEGTFTKSILKQ